MSRGYVYILTNASMPGLVKIGKTERDVERRAAELYQTGVPAPFVVAHSEYCLDCCQVERAVHEALSEHRFNQSREFFSVDVVDATRTLYEVAEAALNELISDIAPGRILVEEPLAVKEAALFEQAWALGAYPHEVAAAYAELTAEQLLPALEIHRQKMDEARARRQAAKQEAQVQQ